MTMRIDGKRWVSMPIAVLAAILAATVSAALALGTFQSNQQSTKTVLLEHTERLQKIENRIEDIREMKNDISWIKQTMQEERTARR